MVECVADRAGVRGGASEDGLGRAVGDSDGTVCRRGEMTIVHRDGGAQRASGSAMLLALRPEKVGILSGSAPAPGCNSVAAEIVDVSYYGSTIEMLTDAASLGRLLVRVPASEAAPIAQPGRRITLTWPADATVEVRPQA